MTSYFFLGLADGSDEYYEDSITSGIGLDCRLVHIFQIQLVCREFSIMRPLAEWPLLLLFVNVFILAAFTG